MAKRTDMGKKFVKRSGKGFDQIKDLKISNDALLILKKNNNSKEQIEKLKKKNKYFKIGWFCFWNMFGRNGNSF